MLLASKSPSVQTLWLPLLVAVIGVILTVGLWRTDTAYRRATRTERFQITAEDRALAIDRAVTDNFSVVAMLGGLIGDGGRLDATTFDGVSETALRTHNAPISALEWAPLVRHEDRAAYEAETGHPIRELGPSGDLVVAATRDSYFPVTLVNPLNANRVSLGYDLRSHAIEAEALDRARDSGMLQVTHRVRLIGDNSNQFGFLAIQPVFRAGTVPGTVEDRRESLAGFTLGAYHANDLIAGALSIFDGAKIEVAVFDRTADPSEQVFAAFPASLQFTSEADLAAADVRLRQQHDLVVGDGRWTILIQATPAFAAISTLDQWRALVIGLLVTALVVVLLRVVLVRADHVRQLVVERAAELRRERDRYQGIFENAQVGIFTTGPDNRLRTINLAGLRLLDRSFEDLRDKTPLDLVAPSHHHLMAERRRRRDAGESIEPMVELRLLHGAKGESRWFSVHLQPMFASGGAFEGTQGIFNDITEQIARREQLTEDATIDPLTGLANRRRFDEFIEEQVAIAQRYDTPVSLLMLDLDHFKQLNDRYGHQAGDEALRSVAVVLTATARDADLVARYGGEEFTVVLAHTDAIGAAAAAERCRAAIEATQCDWDGQTLRFTASVGVATYDKHTHESESELLRDADGAAYAAKQAGRNTVRIANDLAPVLRAG